MERKSFEDFIECEGDEIYPLHEMSYHRSDFIKKVEHFAYSIAEHLILLLSAKFQNNDDVMFRYWVNEVYSKYIKILTLDTLKKNNSYDSRYKVLVKGLFELKDLKMRTKFDNLVVTAVNREREELDRQKINGRTCYPIDVKSDNELFEKYITLLDIVVGIISKGEALSTVKFKKIILDI